MPHFDAILIDFYGTIAAGDRQAVEDTCVSIVRECGLAMSAPEFAIRWGEQFFRVVAKSNHETFRALLECETISLRETLGGLGIRRDVSPFIDQLEFYWRNPPLHDDAIEFLAQTKKPICCVSNADTEALTLAIARHGLQFDAVVSSEDVRAYKPDGAIFMRALELLGVTADRAMHIGDSLHSDIAGAAKAGLTATWIRRDDRIHDIGNHPPHHTVSDLRHVMDLL
ncbi:MAG: HAD family hydrolase [Planctomycetes bacterium]|nr:HAD family hydrolase [Planctomycetota bacterium]MBI3832730.1 HAD family hydrolase [Planctomycetota bacterium]